MVKSNGNSIMVDVVIRLNQLKAQYKGRHSAYTQGYLDGMIWVHDLLKKHYAKHHSLGLPENIFSVGFDFGQSVEFKEGSFRTDRKKCWKQWLKETKKT